ncbi:hypothetical protein WMY93_005494 [Mugilogobius chulae]|uniref:Uncharacterized protein n=1 Tax=Mugilogobius chulae TaxID=88201 RepID=A0AAW0PK55_9GOBI
MDGPGPNKGRQGFGRDRENTSGQSDGPGLNREEFDRPHFGRGGGRQGNTSLKDQELHGFGRDGEDPHREGFGGPGFDRGGKMNCPRPHSRSRDGENRPEPLHSDTSRGPDFRGRDEQGNLISKGGGSRPSFRQEGEFCGPNSENREGGQGNPRPCFRGPPNDHRDPRGAMQGMPFRDNRNRQEDDWSERPHLRRDRRSNERDLRDDQRGPPHRRRSLSRDRSAHRRDQESGLKSDLPKVVSDDPISEGQSSHKKEPGIKSPTPGASGPEQSGNSAVSPKPNTEEKQPPRRKAALLPTPDGPKLPLKSQAVCGRMVLSRSKYDGREQADGTNMKL